METSAAVSEAKGAWSLREAKRLIESHLEKEPLIFAVALDSIPLGCT